MTIQFFLLGHPHLEADGQSIPVPRSKALALLAYLVVTRQMHRRDTLVTLFWANYDQASGRGELRRQLSTLKKIIPDSIFQIERDAIGILPEADIWDDVTQLRLLMKQCDTHPHSHLTTCSVCATYLEESKALLRGNFMEGFTLPDSPAFDQWQHIQTQAILTLAQMALENLATYYYQRHDKEHAIEIWRQLLKHNPGYEPAHRQIMQYFASMGNRADALKQYEECLTYLSSEFDIAPEPQTQQLYHAIRNGFVETPLIKTYVLPSNTSPFVGRQAEMQLALDDVNHPDCRLLTITGMGGIGKTRFALELCRHLSTSHKNVIFVSLQDVSPIRFINTIAEQLRFGSYSHDILEKQLIEYLRGQDLLLVLDNFETHLQYASYLEKIIQQTPHIKIIITSRQRLKLAAEYVLELGVLPYADGASEMFIQYARRVSNQFQPDSTIIPAICEYLGGLPLAIELVAMWARTLSPRQMLEKLKSGDTFIDQTSLDHVFHQSWQMLSNMQQGMLAQLIVFPSSFSSSAAESIIGIPIQTLTELVDHSMLMYKQERFTIHSVLRPYIAIHVVPNDRLSSRFIAYYVDFMQARADRIMCRDMQVFAELELELENIQLATQFAIKNKDMMAVDTFMESLYMFYEAKKLLHSGISTFEGLVKQIDNYLDSEPQDIVLTRRVLARANVYHAVFIFGLGNRQEAVTILERYITYWRESNDTKELASTLSKLGMVYNDMGQATKAQVILHESLALWQKLNHPPSLARTYNNLGVSAIIKGEHDEAYQYLLQCLAIYKNICDYVGISRVYNNLGNVALAKEQFDEAQAYFERTYKIQQQYQFESHWTVACTVLNLGVTQQRAQNLQKARQSIYHAYTLFKTIGHQIRTIMALVNLSDIALELGQDIEAQRYLAEALQMAQMNHEPYGVVYVLLQWIPLLRLRDDHRRAVQIAYGTITSPFNNLHPSAKKHLQALQEAGYLPDEHISFTLDQLALEILALYQMWE